MYDPFIDTVSDSQTLQVPLVPSRSPTPNSLDAAPSTRQISTSNQARTSQLDVNDLFDPLGASSTEPRQSGPASLPPIAGQLATEQPQPMGKRRPTLLTIATASNPPVSTTSDPLGDLLEAKNSPTQELPKAKRPFSTAPLFQPPQPTHMVLPGQPRPKPASRHPSRQGPHARDASDDFGGFVSVPPSTDPLSTVTSASIVPISTTTEVVAERKPNAIVNEFTMAAKQRQQESAARILDEFARSESTGGAFVGWLDEMETKEAEAKVEDRAKWLEERDKKLKGEEGPISPPATPTEGPPPMMRVPKRKKADGTVDSKDTSPERVTSPPRDTERPTISRNTSMERYKKESGSGSGSVIASYFPGTLPRRLTSLLTNPSPATATMAPSPRLLPTSQEAEEEELKEDTRAKGAFFLPGSSSLENLSSMHPRAPKPIPDSFLTHHTPFANVPYIPPSGAPGFAGDRGWDTGGFAADWDEEGIAAEEERRAQEREKKKVKRVVKLNGRREETAGVLTRGLGDAIRPYLPPIARLSTTWTLLYSLDQHGISLQTFYKLSEPSSSSTNKISGGRKGALLVIRDSMDGVFGAWIGDGLRMNHTGEGHFGGGDSFLWKTTSVIPEPALEADEGLLPSVEIYRWTGKNDYIALCEPDFLSLGGGSDGKTGLYLASNLLDGSSSRSLTFDNDILCGEEDGLGGVGSVPAQYKEGRTAKFEVIGLEVWGLVAS